MILKKNIRKRLYDPIV